MTRGDFVSVALPGDKPRPALVVQAVRFDRLPTIVVLPLTSEIVDGIPLIRLPVSPNATNGLRIFWQIMVARIQIVRRDRVGGIIGHADGATMLAVNRSLLLLLGLAG